MGSYLLREYLSFCNQGLVGEVILGTGYEGKCKCLLGKNLCEIISYITSDPIMAKQYNEDEKRNFQFSVNAFIGLLDATILSCDPYYIEKINKDLPVLFVSGGGDLVGNFGEGVRKVYNMYKEAGIKDVTIKIYENGRHEVLN